MIFRFKSGFFRLFFILISFVLLFKLSEYPSFIYLLATAIIKSIGDLYLSISLVFLLTSSLLAIL